MALNADEQSTLEAALAFLDAHYEPDEGDADADEHAKAARKRARNAEAAARSNRRRRVELLELRESVAQLEKTRDELAAAMSGRMVLGAVGSQSSQGARGTGALRQRRDERLERVVAAVAEAETLRLDESRALNHRLRAAVKLQLEAGAALAQLFKKRLDEKSVQDLLRETTFSSAVTSTPSRAVAGAQLGELFSQLSTRLRGFVSEALTVLATKRNDRVLAESRTHAYRHTELGPVLAMNLSFLVPCGIEDGWAHMMSSCRNRVRLLNQREFQYRSEVRPSPEDGVTEKEYAMEFPDAKPFGSIPVHGLALFETVVTQNWWLYIWTAVVAIRGDNTKVCERGWTAMTRTSAGHCVFHMQHEVYSASGEGTGDTNSDQYQQHRQKQQFLADSLLRKARQDCFNVESALVARFGSAMTCVESLFP